jgi:3-carboxy-cis,cis-muconate cycloisomerase
VVEDAGLFDGVFSRGAAATGSQAWLRAMLDTEAALARALERAGLAPAGAGGAVTAAAAGAFDAGALGRQAALSGNPVPGLVAALRRAVPPDAADTVHRGATSQDIIDTAAMLLARGALEAIAGDLAAAADGCARLAAAHRDTLMIGRTLLQQAVPVTFGLVAAGWLTGLDEAGETVARVRAQRLAVQFGGAAGTLASLGTEGPVVARLLAGELGLALPVLPWHTDRSRIVEVAAACAVTGAALAKIARDVTLLAQSEVAEVREGGGSGGERRGGSSAMPHKQNPVAAIAILGCTRRVPGLVATLAAAAEQEFQRAAGAWHAEWEPFADVLRVTGSAASWAVDLTGGLVVDPARMRANLDATRGLPLAERVAGLLAPALGRAAAHDLVARASAHAVAVGGTLRESLLGVPDLAGWVDGAGVTSAQIDAALDPAGYLGSAGAFTDAALAAHARRSLPAGQSG